MRVYDTPGVYYERLDAAPGITAVRTDVAGFVGIATRGPLHTAIPIQSWRQFQAYFGECTGSGYLAYAVRAFFENGGRRCWVVRVASEVAAAAAVTIADPGGSDALRISAFSPGVWGNDVEIRLTETHRQQAIADPARSTQDYAVVPSVGGFSRLTLVRVSRGVQQQWRVISEVDSVERRLYWVHPKPDQRRPPPYDEPLALAGSEPLVVESVEYTLLVRERGRLVAEVEGLSMVPAHERYFETMLRLPSLERGAALRILPAAPPPVVASDRRSSPPPKWAPLDVALGAWLTLSGGRDGLSTLCAADFIGELFDPQDDDVVRELKCRGLRVLEEVREVAIVAVPDIHIQPLPPPEHRPLPPCEPEPCLPPPPPEPPPARPASVGELPPRFAEGDVYQVQAAMVDQAERLRDRIAILDAPFAAAQNDALGVAAARAWRRRFESKFAALYYPWLRVVDPRGVPGEITRAIPPSGHVSGQYASSDIRVGVHKAPANDALAWAQDVTVPINDAVHGVLNPQGINAIRILPGRGLRIFGARTVSSDPDWKYVNVRRLLMMIEKAIDVSLQWAVHEPNDAQTRAKIDLALRSFLFGLWQRGALMGGTANAAFRVVCNDDNNPPSERGNGRMLAEVLVAPSKPFEFVVLRVGRTENAFEFTEGSAGGGW